MTLTRPGTGEVTATRAATGTAVVDGATVHVNIVKTTGLAINGYRCDLDLGTPAGTCTHQFLFSNPADGTSGHAGRNATVTPGACQ